MGTEEPMEVTRGPITLEEICFKFITLFIRYFYLDTLFYSDTVSQKKKKKTFPLLFSLNIGKFFYSHKIFVSVSPSHTPFRT